MMRAQHRNSLKFSEFYYAKKNPSDTSNSYQVIKQLEVRNLLFSVPLLFPKIKVEGFSKKALYVPSAAIMISVPMFLLFLATLAVLILFLVVFSFPISSFFVLIPLTMSIVSFTIGFISVVSVVAIKLYNLHVFHKNVSWVFNNIKFLMENKCFSSSSVLKEGILQDRKIFVEEGSHTMQLVPERGGRKMYLDQMDGVFSVVG